MRRRTQSILSTLLLIFSFGLLVTVGIIYLRDRNNSDPTPPTPVPGHNEAIDVLEAFRTNDLSAEFGAQGTDVRSSMLERPGQMIDLGDARAYVFIYPDTADQEAATLDVLPEDIELLDVSGDPVDYESIELFAGSNVAVVLVDADQETTERVEEAVAALT